MSQIIKVIVKTFEVLETLNRESNLSLKEITDLVKYPKPTVFRLLNTLTSLGYVEQDNDTQTFTLSSKFFSFSDGTARGSEIITLAQFYMENLRNEFKETVNLARLLPDNRIVYINILESDQLFRICNSVGDQADFHSTAVGKVILAYCPKEMYNKILENYDYKPYTKKTITNITTLEEEIAKVKELGYALDNEEGHYGVVCMSSPIFNQDGQAFAAISVSMPKVRANKEVLDKLSQKLPEFTKEISSKLRTNYNILQ